MTITRLSLSYVFGASAKTRSRLLLYLLLVYASAHVGLALCRVGEKGVGRRRSRVVHVLAVVGNFEASDPSWSTQVMNESPANVVITTGQTRDERGGKNERKTVFLFLW
ncbi:hypothetical protein QBC32DRAFT_158730 [Pseudoneurospora amorphoporcata]|uniref:Uncharacterized protein n=1 Tax=Pseudoneurospora amorphoporcata TaxID=241081 RepID=A0AAN6NV95_9PEZI|nr:hypothetical protein QBC32DRAFT_158730 [Pseudoneurospora amorphoporcata]